MTEHRASCQCGDFQLVSTLDPDFVIVCNCTACQKRTGSAFGVGAYFRRSHLTITGESREWARLGDGGRILDYHFCPNCGTTLYWGLVLSPGHVGVALGALDTPPPRPDRAIWTEEQHDWVHFPADWALMRKSSMSG